MLSLEKATQDWLNANNEAVDAASKCMTKKGGFNPPLEKPWKEWDALRAVADEKWYKFREELLESMV